MQGFPQEVGTRCVLGGIFPATVLAAVPCKFFIKPVRSLQPPGGSEQHLPFLSSFLSSGRMRPPI